MITRKLKEAIDELRAEAAELLALANDLEARAKRSAERDAVSAPPSTVLIRPRITRTQPIEENTNKSILSLAIDVLREQMHPMHIREIVPMVSTKRGKEVARADVESSLVRGLKTNKLRGILKRTAPATYSVTS